MAHCKPWLAGFSLFLVASAQPNFAAGEIENEATAQGRHDGQPVVSEPSLQSVPVAEPVPLLSVAVGQPEYGDLDGSNSYSAGDTLTYQITVANEGNLKLDNVAPGELRLAFDGNAAGSVIDAFELDTGQANLAPGDRAGFVGVYTMEQLDILHAAGKPDAVTASVTVLGLRADNGQIYAPSEATETRSSIPAEPALELEKAFAFTQDSGAEGEADIGDVITYRYIVTNTGNVAIENISIRDIHEGVELASGLILEQAEPLENSGPLDDSSDALAGDSKWDVLGAGASVEFTYRHTVTEEEFADQ